MVASAAMPGSAASPGDELQLINDSLKVAASSTSSGGSVLGQDTFEFLKGICKVVGQIPGTQLIVMPVGHVAKILLIGGAILYASITASWLMC